MSVKASGWSGLLALMLLARAAYAQVDVEAPPNVDSLDEAATRVEVAHCNRPACRSIALIDQAVQLQIAGAAATVGRPRPIPRDRDVRVATAYRKLVEQSRRLKPELCRQAAHAVIRLRHAGCGFGGRRARGGARSHFQARYRRDRSGLHPYSDPRHTGLIHRRHRHPQRSRSLRRSGRRRTMRRHRPLISPKSTGRGEAKILSCQFGPSAAACFRYWIPGRRSGQLGCGRRAGIYRAPDYVVRCRSSEEKVLPRSKA